ncbi:MAG: carbohydrate ABC transporter permease [Actinobacteria bacterium]|nr:carbohydrate ABC transporter permease [Actinomycetota bacterium]
MAFKKPNEIFQSFLFFFPKHFTIENFPKAIELAKTGLLVSYQRMYLNSAIVTAGGIILAILAASFGAFSIVYYKFKGREVYYTFVLLSYMIPIQILLIPLYLILYRFKLLNTYFALIFPYGTLGIPIATMILRNFFSQIPTEIRDAAFIDGANSFQIFKNIYLPLAKPALATCIIFLFLDMWNEFLFAFIFIRKESLATLPLAMSKIGMGGRTLIPWGVYAASILIAIVPIFIVFMIFQRWFIKGAMMGSVKG